MRTAPFLFLLILILPFGAYSQEIQRTGTLFFRSGDTLDGELRYEKGRLFDGFRFSPNGEKAEEHRSVAPKELDALLFEGSRYKSLFIPEDLAGVTGHVLAELIVEGPMELYKGRYPYRSCTCQKKPEIMESWLIRKRSSGRLKAVRKNLLLDRIKDAENVARAFLPFDGLAEDVRERRYAYSEFPRAVERYDRLLLERSSAEKP